MAGEAIRLEVGASRTLPVIEETLQVSKREVDRGGYRIVKTVETSDRLIDELLQNQTVQIERRAVGTQVSGTEVPQARYEGDTLIIPVVEEIMVTEKRLVLVEEVRVTRVNGTHRKPQTVSLRKEKVEVERLASENRSVADSP